jgi:transcriptional regulator with XRE-family HTH domain
MEKTIHTNEYAVLLTLLRETRRAAKVTQIELAVRIEETQSQISKIERGEVRLDLIELRTILRALGTSLPAFAAKLEKRLTAAKRKGAESPKEESQNRRRE